jgi:hypothetical protein
MRFLIAFGGLMELGQAAIPGRTADGADVMVNALGVGMGLGIACQRRRENASDGRSKNASRADGRHWFKQRHHQRSFPVRSMSLLSRPDLASRRPRRAA